MEATQTTPYVFLSYASADREKALHIADLLEAQGIAVWIDRKSIPGGSSWSTEIVRGIERCSALVLLMSGAAMVSPNIQQEVQLAWDARRPILPLVINPANPPESIRYALAGRQWIELLDQPDDDWVPRVVQALVAMGATSIPPQASTNSSESVSPAPTPRPPGSGRSPADLPTQATRFIGRGSEVAAVCQELQRPEIRLLTLAGPGGVGKTRLALEVATRLAVAFPGGVFFVPLATVTDPRLVAPTIAQTLGVRESSGQPVLESLQAFLDQKRCLLVLDNFEQILDSVRVISQLLAACPHLRILVTSRSTLNAYGEQEFPVDPLALPPTGALPPLDQLAQYDAIRLFVERARAVRPDFTLTRENAATVADICQRLDGLPLAIELAAARLRLFPPADLLRRLDRRFKVLTGGPKDRPRRQQTLRAAIDWSYDLLDQDERRLFQRLTVFVGGFDLTSAEAVCSEIGDLGVDLLDGLESLVGKSLVRTKERTDKPSFTLLETIREYGRERLDESGEVDEICDRHARYFLFLAEQADPELVGPRQKEWLDRLEEDLPNLRAAIRWYVTKQRAEEAVKVAGALRVFWELHSHVTEGRAFLRDALALPGGVEPSAARGRALFGAARLATLQQDLNTAAALFKESLQIRENLGDKRGVAFSLSGLGWVTFQRGDDEAAYAKFVESLTIRRQLGLARDIATSLVNLAEVALVRQDFAMAASKLDEALPLFRQVGDHHGEATALSYHGNVALARNDLSAARSSFERCFALAREMGHGEGIALALEGLAAVAAVEGRADHAVKMAGAAAAVREAGDVPLSSIEEKQLEWRLEPARRALDAPSQHLAWSQGRALTPEEALRLSPDLR